MYQIIISLLLLLPSFVEKNIIPSILIIIITFVRIILTWNYDIISLFTNLSLTCRSPLSVVRC